jgi:hypothetical protein
MLTTAPTGAVVVSTTGDIGKVVLILERRSINGAEWLRIENGWPASSATFGWVPAVTKVVSNGESREVATLSPIRPSCNGIGAADPASISELPQAVRLACVGRRELRFGPVIVRREPSAEPVLGTPEWLATLSGLAIYGEESSESSERALEIHVSPSLATSLPIDKWLEVSGHFDDPAARDCKRASNDPQYPTGDSSDQILWCRQQFVITSSIDASPPTSTPAATFPNLGGQWAVLPTAPIQGRQGHVAVWTGNEMVIYGGQPGPSSADDHRISTGREGAAFRPSDASWRLLPVSPLKPRSSPLAIWSGNDVLLWGGWSNSPYTRLKDGAAYSPASNTWRLLAPAPLSGVGLSAGAWTGKLWFVLDGIDPEVDSTASLAAFDPNTNSWSRERSLDVPASRLASAAWDGDALILVLQPNQGNAVAWSYRPSSGWTELPAPPVGVGALGGSATWTGSRVLVPAIGAPLVNGQVSDQILEFDPTAAAWQHGSRPPAGLLILNPVWTGHLALFGGGQQAGAYEPTLQRWLEIPPRPDGQSSEATSVWAGDRLLAWGGSDGESGFFPTDGLEYIPGKALTP